MQVNIKMYANECTGQKDSYTNKCKKNVFHRPEGRKRTIDETIEFTALLFLSAYNLNNWFYSDLYLGLRVWLSFYRNFLINTRLNPEKHQTNIIIARLHDNQDIMK